MPALISKKTNILALLGLILLFSQCHSDKHKETGYKRKAPKLVVGIVVDQMRYDFLYRYWDKYGSGGFKRMLKQGYSCANTNINYVPTYTAPGHSAIYTGTTPSVNGIVGNNWYSRKLKKSIYCVTDTTTEPVGSVNMKEGRMSPRNLLCNTITDQLRLSDNMNSKTIGIALKDRGSILPAGHSANAAYWYDGIAGNWITSNFYMNSLPPWVESFNNEKQPAKFLSQKWETLYPINTYTESTTDANDFEEPLKGEAVAVFPYNLPALKGNTTTFELLRETPFGNTYTKNFAEAAIKGEKMGKGDFTDFLAVSFSSTDYIGHRCGPNSVEVEDAYLRLDKDLEEFLDFLDSYIGKEDVLVFLTADHGAANNPNYLKSKGIREPGGCFDESVISGDLNTFLKKTYHCSSLIAGYENQQIYFNYDTLKARNIPLEEISQSVCQFVKGFDGVATAVTGLHLQENEYQAGPLRLVQNGFMPSRCGDVAVVFQPGWIEYKQKGTTHGSGYSYDTHIPLLFYGWRIKPGVTNAAVSMTDIAPTLAALLQIQPPEGCTGKPITGLLH